MGRYISNGIQEGHQHLNPSNHASKGIDKSMELGGGGRFAKLKNELAQKPGVTNPGALAAAIGRKKYGDNKMSSMAAKGRK